MPAPELRQRLDRVSLLDELGALFAGLDSRRSRRRKRRRAVVVLERVEAVGADRRRARVKRIAATKAYDRGVELLGCDVLQAMTARQPSPIDRRHPRVVRALRRGWMLFADGIVAAYGRYGWVPPSGSLPRRRTRPAANQPVEPTKPLDSAVVSET